MVMVDMHASSPGTALPTMIRFGRAICGDLQQAERHEWWLANAAAPHLPAARPCRHGRWPACSRPGGGWGRRNVPAHNIARKGNEMDGIIERVIMIEPSV